MFVKILLALFVLASFLLSGCGTSYEERVRKAGGGKADIASKVSSKSLDSKSKTLLGAVSSSGSASVQDVDPGASASKELGLTESRGSASEPKKEEVAKIKDSSEDLVETARLKAAEVKDVAVEEDSIPKSEASQGEQVQVTSKAVEPKAQDKSQESKSNPAASIMKRTTRVKELANSKKADYIKHLDSEFQKFEKELEVAKDKALKIVTDAKAKVSKDMELFNSSLSETEKQLADANSLDAKGIEQLNNSLDRIVGELKESLGVE